MGEPVPMDDEPAGGEGESMKDVPLPLDAPLGVDGELTLLEEDALDQVLDARLFWTPGGERPPQPGTLTVMRGV